MKKPSPVLPGGIYRPIILFHIAMVFIINISEPALGKNRTWAAKSLSQFLPRILSYGNLTCHMRLTLLTKPGQREREAKPLSKGFKVEVINKLFFKCILFTEKQMWNGQKKNDDVTRVNQKVYSKLLTQMGIKTNSVPTGKRLHLLVTRVGGWEIFHRSFWYEIAERYDLANEPRETRAVLSRIRTAEQQSKNSRVSNSNLWLV